MSSYRYQLEKYNGMKTRYTCPSCEKSKKFTRYIDTHTNEYVGNVVGYCERINKCGYHYKPKQYFQDNNITTIKTFSVPTIKKQPKPSFFNVEVMNNSVMSKNSNHFINFLSKIWDRSKAEFLANKYNVGTSIHWNGATTFWQQDIKGNVRTGKIILYNANNGKRIKKYHPAWEHKKRQLNNFNLKQCFFGEHLINTDRSKPIAICESEKSAIICSEFFPQFIWLATGGIHNLSRDKSKVLKGRNVILFPDVGGYNLWNDKIPKLTSLATFKTSTLLEKNATEKERKDGLDIADYLLRSLSY